ncbi:MAG: restriction endonuclease subunit S [Candidatus Paceibacterota bacterium]
MSTVNTEQNIPEGWQRVKLGEFGVTLGGLSGKNKTHFGHGKSFITYMNVFSNSHLNRDMVNFVEIKEGERQNKLQYGDYLFTTSSETPKEVGMSSVVDFEPGELYLNSFCFIFRPQKDLLEPSFGGYMFRGPIFRRTIATHAKGSTRFNLSKKDFLDVDVVFPNSKSAQKKIAEILSTVDEEIQKTDEIITATEKLKRGLMRQLFTRGIGHTKFKKSKIGEVPSAWDVAELGSFLLQKPDYGINAPGVDYAEDLPTYIRITDISEDGKFISGNKKSVDHKDSSNYRLRNGDLLFARTGASVGKTYLYKPEDGDLVFAGFLIRVCPDKSKLLPQYLSYFVQTSIYWNWVRVMSTRSGQPGINGNEYSGMIIPVPPLSEQEEVIEVLSLFDEKISINRKLKEKLNLLKRALMQDLLSGKKRTV